MPRARYSNANSRKRLSQTEHEQRAENIEQSDENIEQSDENIEQSDENKEETWAC